MKKLFISVGIIFVVLAATIVFFVMDSRTTKIKAIALKDTVQTGTQITKDSVIHITVPRGTRDTISDPNTVINKYATRVLYKNQPLITEDIQNKSIPSQGIIVIINSPPLNDLLSTGMPVYVVNTPSKNGSTRDVDPTIIPATVQSVVQDKGEINIALVVAQQDQANKILVWNAANSLGIEIQYGNKL